VRRTDQRRAAIFISYQRDVTGAPLDAIVARGGWSPRAGNGADERPGAAVTPFTRELAEGTEAAREELDELISANAVDWSLERIAPLERAILRVALFEILHRPDVPDEVAIDEAVETAKLYCGTEAPAFVNGILGGVMKRLDRTDRRPA
jgi:transcription antitermination protein NusB